MPIQKLGNALDERHHVSIAIDYTQIRGVVPTDISPAPASQFALSASITWPFAPPTLRKQRRNRQFLFPRVSNVFRKIRVRQLLCLDHRVQRLRRPKPHLLSSGNVSRMFTISSAAMPCTFGGSS